MGGQACVLYGAAEFSRDIDLAIVAGPANLSRLRAALAELRADVIAVPPFELKYLRKGPAPLTIPSIRFSELEKMLDSTKPYIQNNSRGAPQTIQAG